MQYCTILHYTRLDYTMLLYYWGMRKRWDHAKMIADRSFNSERSDQRARNDDRGFSFQRIPQSRNGSAQNDRQSVRTQVSTSTFFEGLPEYSGKGTGRKGFIRGSYGKPRIDNSPWFVSAKLVANKL